MKTNLGFLAILLICLWGFQGPVLAQSIQNVDINSLSKSQINQAKKALGSSGLSIEQAIAEAQKRGASESQIQEMVKRMEKKNGGVKESTTVLTPETESYMTQDSLEMKDQRILAESIKPDVVSDSANFGSYLFNSKNLSFEPGLNIQTPKNYEINIGDEILVNIWGNSVQNYQLDVDRNGQIQIPQIGPIYIVGQSFDKASTIIKRRLSAIYMDMVGKNPNTFAQISMGRLRSIQVNLVGEVEMPGTYTLPATAAAFNALYLSGGPSEFGSFRNIEIHRDGKLYRTIDMYDFLLKADQSDNLILKSEDVIFVPIATKHILMSGEFKRKAFFELKPEENLDDLIRFAGGFTDLAYTLNVKIYRKLQDGLQVIDVPFTELANTSLQDGDNLIAEKTLSEVENRVILAGSVYRPGEYQWEENLMLSELIIRADSILPSVEIEMGHLTRLNPDSTLRLIAFNVLDVLSGKNDIRLEPKDSIMLKSHFELKDNPTITVDGRVRTGGTFDYMDNISVIDAIYMAGGFKEDADTNYVQISRRLSYDEAASLTDKLLDVFNVPISRSMKVDDQSSAFKLQPYDHVFIRKAPGAADHGTVYIGGEVVYSGYYAIQNKKDRLSDLIAWAGGLTSDAYIEAATLTKVEAGPVGVELEKILNNPRSLNDLKLNPGDHLVIPQRPETVNVFGQVQNPFAIVYTPGKSVKYYIEKSGGWSDSPHRRRVYVTYPDGSSSMTRNFIAWRYPKVKPGAKIYVPKKPEKTNAGDAFGKLLATASTTASLAVTVIALTNLLNKE